MASFSVKSFDSPDETRSPDKTTVDVVDLGDAKAARSTLQPGWRWSECIKPVVGGNSCQARHVGTLVSARMHVAHDDGTEGAVVAGDARDRTGPRRLGGRRRTRGRLGVREHDGADLRQPT